MTSCKFHETVVENTFPNLFLEITIVSAISEDLFATVTSIMAENDIKRLPKGRGAHRNSPPYATHCFADLFMCQVIS